MLMSFFREEIENYDINELNPLAKDIIGAFMNNATLQDYISLMPMKI